MRRLTRREALQRLGAIAAGPAVLTACATGADKRMAQRRRPNVVFIYTDDQRWDALSCMGHPFLKTPNIDRIASEGMLFKNAFVTTALCSPSRASFLTGTYAHVHGVKYNEICDYDPKLATYPQVLQRAGYETAYIGKWHQALKADPRPGFNYWLSFRGQGQYINPEFNENGQKIEAKGYMTDLLTDYAEHWLQKDRDKPFCLILAHKAVHGPFTPAQRHANLYNDAVIPEPPSNKDTLENKPRWQRYYVVNGAAPKPEKDLKPAPDKITTWKWDGRASVPHLKDWFDYYRTIQAVDDSVGRVLATLEKAKCLDDTIVIFASDNGMMWGDHHLGDKRLMYEESIRIPLLARYPKLIKPGSVNSDMVLNIDLAPTLCDLAGVAAPSTMQGRSFVPLLRGKRVPWRTSWFYEYFKEAAYPTIETIVGVRTQDWKYVTYPEIEDLDELYDLKNDPNEMHNLAVEPAYKARIEEMKAELSRLRQEAGV